MPMIMKLKPKDKIALVCTGTPCDSEQDVQDVQAFLESTFNCEVEYSPDCYLGLPAKERAANFLSFALDPKVKAIWAMRGGEGTADLLPYISPQLMKLIKLDKKFLIGFSDFTPFLTYFYDQLNWQTIHGACGLQLTKAVTGVHLQDESFDMLRELLLKGKLPIIDQLEPLNDAAKQPRHISALVTGGNISLLGISIRDAWHVNTKNRIVLLEEVNEKPHRFARTLKYLMRIGFFNEAKALIFAGVYFEPHHSDQHELFNNDINIFLQEFADSLDIPVLYTSQVSHGAINRPMPYYLKARLSLGETPSIEFSES